MAQHIPYHPAPGISGLMPGFVRLPVLTNPVTFQNRVQGATTQTPGLGAFMAARFTVPQNPVVRDMTKGMGCGYGCGRSAGMGALNFDVNSILNGTAGWQTYAVIGGSVLALLWLTGGKSKYHATRGQRAEKKARVASAQAAYYRALGS